MPCLCTVLLDINFVEGKEKKKAAVFYIDKIKQLYFSYIIFFYISTVYCLNDWWTLTEFISKIHCWEHFALLLMLN